jgi:hypothetical protein
MLTEEPCLYAAVIEDRPFKETCLTIATDRNSPPELVEGLGVNIGSRAQANRCRLYIHSSNGNVPKWDTALCPTQHMSNSSRT